MERERGPGDSGGGGKTKKKEKGYKTVGLDTSEDDDDAAMIIGGQSAGKSKPKPAFRLKKKKSFKDKAAESRDRKIDESVERTKIKRKIPSNPFIDPAAGDLKQSLPERPISNDDTDTQIFSIPLAKAVAIDRCPDGIDIPAFFRVCVNYIEDNGLDTVGVYRTSGSQSKIQELKQHFNRGNRVRLNDYDVATVADVMKLFIRELPHRLLPEEFIPELEEAIELPDVAKRPSATAKVLTKLDACSRALLGCVFVHMSHIIDHQEHNKMPLKNVALVLEPTLRIQSNKVLSFLLTHAVDVFPDVKIAKPVAPTSAVISEPEILGQLREELAKKEVLLNHLHHEVKQGKVSKRKEEQLWDVQRQVTELKRKIRTYEKMPTVNIGQEKAEKAPKSTSHPAVKPKPAVRTAVVNKLTDKEPTSKPQDPVAETHVKDEVIDEVRRKDMIHELIHQISLYEALQNHNKFLRDKIVKESEALARIEGEISQLNNQYQPQVPEESDLDRDALMKELSELIQRYNMHKTMSVELTDAICSETSGWIGVLAEVNSRKARQSVVGNLI
ncbi:hypothetical protein RvY_04375 [Ramazzottius varieornatus]|uniref:Rho-GAP domain-containing protein n=1 Tax=Ramazzottius varieornatus TaxID=947166 RepID=A0A1D1UUZ9_RAMVA|nr:hypothetical protein RvY_04375 [Ramazzottius varieornatus]